MVLQLQVVGHVPKKCLSINLFDIHVRFYRCVKIWMGKICRIFGRSSILPNFSSAKVSLHMVSRAHNTSMALNSQFHIHISYWCPLWDNHNFTRLENLL